MFFLYILQSEKDSSYYVGYSDNLEKRLYEHNSFTGRYTSRKKPWKLVYCEEYIEKSDALKREQYIKRMKSKRYIEELIGASR